jgi:hypothetical protein
MTAELQCGSACMRAFSERDAHGIRAAADCASSRRPARRILLGVKADAERIAVGVRRRPGLTTPDALRSSARPP